MKKNILCIDDSKTNLLILKDVIEDSENQDYNVLTAISAKEGLDILLSEKIDIVLLDIVMPEIDGFAAAKIIKEHPSLKNIPIIFVTAKNDDNTIENCYKVGGVDYINKPFNATELIHRIGFHTSLAEKENEIEKERYFVQSILDFQDNMIVVTDSIHALHVNKEMLKFFNISSLEEFQRLNICINSMFVKEDGFFFVESKDKNLFWIDTLLDELQLNDVVVKIINNGVEYIFTIKASKVEQLYILSFTDISFISRQSKEYEHSANFDTLTQVYNRNKFNKTMEEKIAITKNTLISFVFVMIDIDHFKRINDTYGHLVGDEILKEIVKVTKAHIRKDDLFARWGGEEFVLAFDVDLKRGLEIAENLRKGIEEHLFKEIKHLTCSFGVTQYVLGEKLEDTLLRADKALYEAKAGGRNRVESVLVSS
jgi:two-component system cell cycle response regulator